LNDPSQIKSAFVVLAIPKYSSIMESTLRPKKRQRTKKDQPLVEGDASASNAVTTDIVQVQTRRGVISRRVFVPLDSQKANEHQASPAGEIASATEHLEHLIHDNFDSEERPHQNKVSESISMYIILQFCSNNNISGILLAKLMPS